MYYHIFFIFPQTGLPVGFYLRKRNWTRWWARCAVLGADLAVLGDLALLGALGWVGRGIWPCWARCAVLHVRFGCARRAGVWLWRAGLGADLAVCILCMVYIVHVFFMMSLYLSSYVFQIGIMGLEQNKAWHWWITRSFEQSVFEKYDGKWMKWK